MMKKPRRHFALPILITAIGVAWALNIARVMPGVNWIWICTLAALGLFTLCGAKLNKTTLVTGLFFLAVAAGEILRQHGALKVQWEIPLLVIVLGVLMLMAQLLPLAEATSAFAEEHDDEA